MLVGSQPFCDTNWNFHAIDEFSDFELLCWRSEGETHNLLRRHILPQSSCMWHYPPLSAEAPSNFRVSVAQGTRKICLKSPRAAPRCSSPGAQAREVTPHVDRTSYRENSSWPDGHETLSKGFIAIHANHENQKDRGSIFLYLVPQPFPLESHPKRATWFPLYAIQTWAMVFQIQAHISA